MKGGFETVWRACHADIAGFDRFMADIEANLTKHQWADW
jgi:hypothetical protein